MLSKYQNHTSCADFLIVLTRPPPFFALFQKSQKSVFWQLRQNGTFDLNEIWYAVGAQGGLSGVSNMNQIGSVVPELVLKI